MKVRITFWPVIAKKAENAICLIKMTPMITVSKKWPRDPQNRQNHRVHSASSVWMMLSKSMSWERFFHSETLLASQVGAYRLWTHSFKIATVANAGYRNFDSNKHNSNGISGRLPKCTHCCETVHPSDIELVLDGPYQAKYGAVSVRQYLMSEPDARYCPVLGFALYMTSFLLQYLIMTS